MKIYIEDVGTHLETTDNLNLNMAEGQLNLTVVDVYDQAAIIGKEFECIIDNFGADAVTSLMPKVIRILEQLEILASRK